MQRSQRGFEWWGACRPGFFDRERAATFVKKVCGAVPSVRKECQCAGPIRKQGSSPRRGINLSKHPTEFHKGHGLATRAAQVEKSKGATDPRASADTSLAYLAETKHHLALRQSRSGSVAIPTECGICPDPATGQQWTKCPAPPAGGRDLAHPGGRTLARVRPLAARAPRGTLWPVVRAGSGGAALPPCFGFSRKGYAAATPSPSTWCDARAA